MRQLKITKSITDRREAGLDKYLTDVSKHEMITVEDEVRLAVLISKGDHEALNKLVSANLRFVISVAKQYQKQGLGLMDLINEGNLGLIKAAQRFDHSRGFKFISYAVWWIRQGIMQAIAEQSRMVRLPLNQVAAVRKYKNAIAKLEQKYDREPTNAELAEILDIPEFKVVESQRGSTTWHLSVDAPVIPGEDRNMLDVLADSNKSDRADYKVASESLRTEIDRTLDKLKTREAEVIRLFYGIGLENALSLEEIAERYELTRERVRQIRETAIKKLRVGSRSKLLREFLG